MIKLLHTSDLHLNALKRYPGYLQRAKEVLAQIHISATKNKCDIIVVAGDIWNTKNITHEERKLFSDWLGASPLPTVVISGNHDKRSEEIGDTCLSYLSSLNPIMKRHLIWDGAPTVQDFHGCRFILFPAQDWKDTELDLMLQVMVKYASTTNKDNKPIVVVLHEAIVGSTTDTGFPLRARIKLRKGKFPEVTYWALGDIHKRQAILPNAHYCGNPFQTRFDEALKKGVLVVSLDHPTKPKFKTIKSLPLLQLEELPDPIPRDAYIQYKPTSIVGKVDLPPNVTFHPDAQLFKRSASQVDSSFGLFDGLDRILRTNGLEFKRRKLSWKLVKQMCKKADKPVSISVPKKYRQSKS